MGKYDGCTHKVMAKNCRQFKPKYCGYNAAPLLLLLLLQFRNKINKLYEDLKAIGRQILIRNNNKLHKLLFRE